MTAEVDLVRAVAADIDNPEAWQVYLDWLLEREDPRAELMRLQMAREAEDDQERRRALDAQLYHLFKAHNATWLDDLNKLELADGYFTMARGVVGHVNGSPSDLAKHADRILEAAPLLTSISLRLGKQPDLSPLAGSPLLARIRRLDLFGLGGDGVRRVTGWDVLDSPTLRRISMWGIPLGPEDTEALAARRMPALEGLELILCERDKTASAARTLEPLARMSLRRFEMAVGHIGPALGETLGKFRSLTFLRIPGNNLCSAGCAALAPALANVTHLDLTSNGLVVDDLARLLRPDSQLAVLKLGGNLLSDEGAEQIAAWPGARNLTHLDLDCTGMTDRGALAIASSKQLSTKLVKLELGEEIAAKTKRALLDAPHLASARIYVGDKLLSRKANKGNSAKRGGGSTAKSKPAARSEFAARSKAVTNSKPAARLKSKAVTKSKLAARSKSAAKSKAVTKSKPAAKSKVVTKSKPAARSKSAAKSKAVTKSKPAARSKSAAKSKAVTKSSPRRG